ncbi:C-Jun-amino-terminal kinase-interacting protein 4 isoform X2 [Corythoichthys intestinalis]|uniref:C-Jun-amino-terminal kinase-interacting protein 4 isoform X2 n=1 Tax=Corythoichthys intestinalis TaxID=161448 RepID=UPI0025A61010|nr:C-Jun-amino-terminal kinase-interacting protein 4 isoform X2 [Corythoichthys intestinalis]
MTSSRPKTDSSKSSRGKPGLPIDAAILGPVDSTYAELLQSTIGALKMDLFDKIDSLSTNLRSEMSLMKGEFKTAVAGMHQKLEAQGATLAKLEQHATDNDARIMELEASVGSMLTKITHLEDKCEDMESRMRRNNIRLIGIPEGVEGPRPAEFMAKLLQELLGLAERPLLDRAHRILRDKPRDGGPPRPVVIRVHLLHVRNEILRKSSEVSPIVYKVNRFEEREAELKKEYNALHQRHTEMIHSYMEHLERTKNQHTVTAEPLDSATGTSVRIRKERPISMGLFHVPGTDATSTDLQRDPVDDQTESWKYNNLCHPRSNTSLKDELANTDNEGSRSGTVAKTNSTVSRTGSLKTNTTSSMKSDDDQSSSPLSHGVVCSNKSTSSRLASACVASMESEGTPQEECGLNKNLDCDVSTVQGQVEMTNQESETALLEGGKITLEKSEVLAIIESTPELDMELEGCQATSTPTKGGIENLAFDRNTDSLFEELSSAGNEYIGDVDEGADLLGMGREVEHLIQENAQLLETKNALNVVKNDLIARMDELACEKEVLQGELDAVTQAKIRLEEKNKDLEDQLKKARAELEESKLKSKTENEDDSDVPTAQRKRFTRVEMARVLMERNQYKERLMELQEAVRWTEMIRASKENSPLPEKKKSSLWQFRLFSSSGGASKKPAPEAPVNVKYNAPTSQIQPSVKKRSSTLQQLPSDKSKAFDFLNEESAVDNVVSRREQKRAQYQQVKAHVQKEEEGRVQAYGWSLPKKLKNNGGQEKVKNLPVPVFLRPLDEKNASMKLWCAAGVHLSGGKTRDGGSIVGASVFYSNVSGPESPKKKIGSQSSLEKLDQELKEQQKELRQQDELSSLVWICTSTQSTTKAVVIDANQPGIILDSFYVCNAHILCITSVPGARETDYPAGEELTLSSESAPVETACSSDSSSNTTGSDGVLGGITVVGCIAEGATAIPQTADSAGKENGEAEATEESESSHTGAYSEHVFTDPLGLQQTAESSANYSERECELVKDGKSCNSTAEEQNLMREDAQKMSSVLPTMWLGAQNGCVYVHSSVAQWKKCLHSIKLKDSVLGIVHVKGRVLVGLSDGTLAIFHRGVDGQWDLTNYHLLDLGKPNHSVRCMTVVHDKVWCGFRNKIFVVHPKAMKIEKSFDAHPRKESQVRQLAWDGDGIWVSIRLDSTLRLFHAHTFQHLQDVDIEPYVSKMLGTGKLGFSFVRITALMVSCNRLWIGTGNGVIISIPLAETNMLPKGDGSKPGSAIHVYGDESSDKVAAGTFVPYCSMAHAQLCFHGHRDAVKFFTAVPGHTLPSTSSCGDTPGDKSSETTPNGGTKSMLVMSGGEGYIDFRMGDEEGESNEGDEAPMKLQSPQSIAERSHLIVWQVLDNGE